MKVLTVCQPWAWAIIHGPKRIENRPWSTSYRGQLIHAGKSISWLCDRLNDGSTVRHGELVFGAVIGTVELIDCIPINNLFDAEIAKDPFAEGPYLWIVRNPRALRTPVPWRGSQMLWNIDDDVVAKWKFR